jgi:hypothetical protein
MDSKAGLRAAFFDLAHVDLETRAQRRVPLDDSW